MAGAITITGLKTFKDQSGDLTLVSPTTTDRPVNYFNVPAGGGTVITRSTKAACVLTTATTASRSTSLCLTQTRI